MTETTETTIGEKRRMSELPTNDKAVMLAAWLNEKKAKNIVALDLHGLCPISEAMVIASAANTRQAKALADFLLKEGGKRGFSYLGMEGYKNAQWILLDFNDVLVHIFLEETRGFYNIEGLWSEGGKLVPPCNDVSQGSE